jgi:DNA-binding Lrp family transcriptional regulator
MAIDHLDRKLLQYLTSGISSYEELARTCNVTRNTVYRRIATLERKGIIKNTIKCNVNLDVLGITPIFIGIKVTQTELNKACQSLSSHKNVRLLLRSYGNHNLNLIAFCLKGMEGRVIQSITTILEACNATDVEISVGFIWEKSDLNTIEDQFEIDEQFSHIIKEQIK